MARQVIVLEQNFGEQGTRQIRCVFWYVVPATGGRQVPRPGFVSLVPSLSAQEQTDLENGVVLEEVVFISFPTSYTTAQMKAEVQARYTDKLSAVTAAPATRAFYGVFFDSVTGWSA